MYRFAKTYTKMTRRTRNLFTCDASLFYTHLLYAKFKKLPGSTCAPGNTTSSRFDPSVL